jgi:hypothetical protein
MKLRLPTSRRAAWTLTIIAAAVTLSWFGGRWYSASLHVGRDAVGISHGCAYINHNLGLFDEPPIHWEAGLNGPPFYWAWWGAGVARSAGYRGASFPLWCIAIPALVTAALSWRPTLEQLRRERAGHCPGCGYDRRGLGEAPCPECGLGPDRARDRPCSSSPASP